MIECVLLQKNRFGASMPAAGIAQRKCLQCLQELPRGNACNACRNCAEEMHAATFDSSRESWARERERE